MDQTQPKDGNGHTRRWLHYLLTGIISVDVLIHGVVLETVWNQSNELAGLKQDVSWIVRAMENR